MPENRQQLLETVFEKSAKFIEASRVSDGQSCNDRMMEYLIPTQYVRELWYAIEMLKHYDQEAQRKTAEAVKPRR